MDGAYTTGLRAAKQIIDGDICSNTVSNSNLNIPNYHYMYICIVIVLVSCSL